MPLPAIIVLSGAAIFGIALYEKKRTKHVFVSYYYKDDYALKRMLKLWDKNSKIDFRVNDKSTDISIPSGNEKIIKRKIQRQMERCDFVLVLIGDRTHMRPWVQWEIELAKKLGLPIIAVKKSKSAKSPKQLLSSGVTWVYEFKLKKIKAAISSLQ